MPVVTIMLPPVDGFKVHELIGGGGFAEVFRATDWSGKVVALNLITPRFRQDAAARKALMEEGDRKSGV